jgi:hypothetical protein
MPSSRKIAPRRTASSAGHVKFSDKLTDSLDDISGMIREHQGMIDSIQEIALELTEAIGSLHTLTLKYAGKANQVLDLLLPVLNSVPLVPKKVTTLLTDMEKWTQKIIDNQAKTKKTIVDVKSGLKTGDVNKLKGKTGELKKVTKTLTALIPSGR